jgi:hypothetical protein
MAAALEKGDRVELIAVPGDSDYCRLFRLRAGQAGEIELTDSQGTIHVRWDSGQRVGILGTDRALLRKAP